MKSKAGKATMMGVFTVAVGLITAGCATNDREYTEYEESVTVTEPSGAEAVAVSTSSTQDEMIIPLHEEQLKVGKRTVDSGHVTIRKVITTETVSEPVELRRENLMIERRGVGGSDSLSSSGFGAPFEEKAVTIQLQSEEPVVETTTVTTGEVVARKNVEWDKQTIQRDVRREDISVDRQTPGAIKEAAGAESKPAPRDDYDDDDLEDKDLEFEE